MNETRNDVNPKWFSELLKVGLRDSLQWLSSLPNIERIANFGCWGGSEPFALLWTLNAAKISVIEKDPKNKKNFDDQLELVNIKIPDSLAGRTTEFIIADMTSPVNGLPDDYFDLAYCENVLYIMDADSMEVVNAINEMSRITRSGGFIVAVEPKFRARFKKVEHAIIGEIPVQISEPEDMSHFFTDIGLVEQSVINAPPYSYCYQKQ